VSRETVPPYDRPPLSKELHAGAACFRDPDWYAENRVELLLGREATGLSPESREVALSDGTVLPYSSLLVATGADPLVPPPLRGAAHVIRTIDDAEGLSRVVRSGARIAVVGAGVLGLEVASTARAAGAAVTAIDLAPVPLGRLVPPRWGEWIEEVHRREGVEFRLGDGVADCDAGGVTLSSGARVEADVVVAAVGVRPATGWVGFVEAGQPVPVARDGASAVPGVYAAGDAAACDGERTEHWEAAAREGMAAARGMLGLPVPPPAAHSFWTDQYGMRVQLIGDHGAADRETVDGDPDSRDFAVTWWRGERPIGGLLVGRPRELPALRRLIDAHTRHEGENVVLQG
jgi:NADPH-dependent 2,4-dienoyl-CoA reductase/sulfur reductase-like enzyme